MDESCKEIVDRTGGDQEVILEDFLTKVGAVREEDVVKSPPVSASAVGSEYSGVVDLIICFDVGAGGSFQLIICFDVGAGGSSGNRPMKRLVMLISLNVACSTAELLIGLLSGSADFSLGFVSDAFHLTFGYGLLTFSLFTMAASRRKADRIYTYGHHLIVSVVTNLFVNLIGIWFFRNYAHVTLATNPTLV
ncbi:hypothetical protein L2E82_20353 [Cichorium intybus]|uniref:Uncharacterized protein n=1 Tax=Cichorium intybus TaxID=13427 RepID=A0ACB9DT45_CICIN|nr:hypothetical protein L2E82_20353 [Cichorium intybus]